MGLFCSAFHYFSAAVNLNPSKKAKNLEGKGPAGQEEGGAATPPPSSFYALSTLYTCLIASKCFTNTPDFDNLPS
jgi:hypothetical protein